MKSIPKIALLLESSRASGRAMLKGVADYAHLQGPWAFFWETGGLETMRGSLRSIEADGIITRDGDHLNEVLKLRIPTVIVGHKRKEVTGVINVITDSPQVGRTGADHLIQCGFRNFGFVGFATDGKESISWSQVREDNFAERVREAGYTSHHFLIDFDSSRNRAKDRAALIKWLSNLPKPIGLMACNDDCGVQLMEACKATGIPVPDAVGVLGVDNDELVCGLSNPAMSSVAINFERAGYEAAGALAALMENRPISTQRINVPVIHVVTRRSTDFVAVADEHLARALRCIKDNARQAISVDDVARVAGLSRRALERRFRVELGVSILDQIRKVRTDQICRMLVETNLSVSQIGDLLGFPDLQHFARYFRSAHSMSPLEYRRTHQRKSDVRLTQKGESIPQSGVGRVFFS